MALPKTITLRVVLQHMQGMEQRLTVRIDKVDIRLGKVETRLTQVEQNLSRQIDGIDKRLDELEIAKLPARVSTLERHAGLAAA